MYNTYLALSILLVLLLFFTNYNFIKDKAKFYRVFFKGLGVIYILCVVYFSAPFSIPFTDAFSGYPIAIAFLLPLIIFGQSLDILKRYVKERNQLGYKCMMGSAILSFLLIINIIVIIIASPSWRGKNKNKKSSFNGIVWLLGIHHYSCSCFST